jgi:hypothetical protein
MIESGLNEVRIMEPRRPRPTLEEIVEDAQRGVIDDYDAYYSLTDVEAYGSEERAALVLQLITAQSPGAIEQAKRAAEEWFQAHPDDPSILSARRILAEHEERLLAPRPPQAR